MFPREKEQEVLLGSGAKLVGDHQYYKSISCVHKTFY